MFVFRIGVKEYSASEGAEERSDENREVSDGTTPCRVGADRGAGIGRLRFAGGLWRRRVARSAAQVSCHR